MATKKEQARRAARCVAGAVGDGTGAAWFRLSKYERRARAFLAATGARLVARLVDDAARPGWEDGGAFRSYHCKYRVRISSAAGSMTIPAFYDSAHNWEQGRRTVGAYDILACIQKTDPGAFDDFAAAMGYFPLNSQADYTRARAAWRGCCREAAGVARVWPSDHARDVLGYIN